MDSLHESTSVEQPRHHQNVQGFEVPVDVKTAARFLGVAGVCLRRAKADSPFPNHGPLNSVQHLRTRKVAAQILREWRNR